MSPYLVSIGADAHSIIAITRLGSGHAFRSFGQRDGNYMWLRKQLPVDQPGARVLIYGYDSHLLEYQDADFAHSCSTVTFLGGCLCFLRRIPY
jgi:hypothetical protein